MADTSKDRLYADANLVLFELFEEAYDPLVTGTQSPIEELLLKAIALYSLINHGRWIGINEKVGDEKTLWHVQTQASIKSYRVDFLFSASGLDKKFVIECDGHEFHERTKEQALKDRSRDRELQRLGYVVLRFTGSEIWSNAWGCVEEIHHQTCDAYARENG